MEKWNEELLNLFVDETNLIPTYSDDGIRYHTLDYVNWLEKRATEAAPNNLQQLKAEIAAIANEILALQVAECDYTNKINIVERMRQLSAV